MRLTNQQVGRAGELFVAAEIHRRGGYAVTFSGNMPGVDMLASDRDNTHRVSIQVKTKGPNSAGWQTSTRHGLPSDPADPTVYAGRFWVFVDLRPNYPDFYVMPELWIRRDIYEGHKKYLARHGGHRPGGNDASEHCRILPHRVAEWQDAWNLLGIFTGDGPADSTRRDPNAGRFVWKPGEVEVITAEEVTKRIKADAHGRG